MKTISVSLKEMLLAVLRRWYVLLVIAIMFAGAYALVSRRSYQSKVNSLSMNTEIAAQIKAQEKDIQAQESYIKHSILYNSDPLNIPVASLDLDIDSAGPASEQAKISNHYLTLAQGLKLSEVLKGLVPDSLGEPLLKEIISFKRVDNDIVNIQVLGNQGYDPLRVAYALMEQLQLKRDIVRASAADHSLSVLGEKSSHQMDQSVQNLRNTTDKNLADAKAKLEKLQAANPAALKRPSLIRDGLLGGFAGLVLGALLVLMVYLIFLPIQYKKQPQDQLGLRYLGDIAKQAELSTANLKEATGPNISLLLTGRVEEKALAEAAETLRQGDGPAMLTGANLHQDAATVGKLAQAEGVVLLLVLGKSRVRNIAEDIQRVDQSGKKLVGYFII